jgi:hypothetical protein
MTARKTGRDPAAGPASRHAWPLISVARMTRFGEALGLVLQVGEGFPQGPASNGQALFPCGDMRGVARPDSGRAGAYPAETWTDDAGPGGEHGRVGER